MATLLQSVLRLDTRSLAVFRVGLGLLLLADILERSRNLTAHYTDAGVLPRSLLLRHGWTEGYWSLHLLSGGVGLQAALFTLAALLALLLAVGWRTRVVAVASWVLIASVQARNPLILQGGDDLLRLLMFWAMFLPLGASWSLDARRSGPDGNHVQSVAALALIVQISIMYIATAALKTGPEWTSYGTAVALALRWETYATPAAELLLLLPTEALKGLTWSVLAWEIIGPALLFVPWRQERIRLGVVAGMIGMHIGFGVCLNLGLFSFTSVVAWTALIPGWVWDRSRKPTASSEVIRSTLPLNILVGALLLYVTLWNSRTIAFSTVETVFPRALNPIAYHIRLEQYWTMFAPSPPRHNTWWQIEGHLADGSVVDLYSMGPLTQDRPADISATYDGQRWRKYMFNLPNKKWLHTSTTRWFVKRWRAAHPDTPLTHVRLVRWTEWVRPRGHDEAERKPMALFAVHPRGRLQRLASPKADFPDPSRADE